MIRIKWKPNRAVSRAFRNMFVGPQQAVVDVMNDAEKAIYDYWARNVYTYFDARASAGLANTGQLGNSLYIKTTGHLMEMYMREMHNPRTVEIKMFRMPGFTGAMNFSPFSMPSVGIGIKKDYDYGELLRNGFSGSSKGFYSYEYDAKVKPGYHPGYDKNTRWVPWKKDFDKHSMKILENRMMAALRKAGVTDITWRVDIQI